MDLKITATPSPQAQGKVTSGHEQKKKRMSQDGTVGLVNIGNSCYMNSALQALSNSPPFRQYFLECHSTSPQPAAGRVSDALASLFQKMWASDHACGHLSPRQISSAMKNPMFRSTQQHDAQEFLRSLLTQVHDETSYSAPPIQAFRRSLTFQDSNVSQDSNDSQSDIIKPMSEGPPDVESRAERPSNSKDRSEDIEKQTLDLKSIYVLDLELKRVVSVHKMETVSKATGPISTHPVPNELLLRDIPLQDAALKDTPPDAAPPKDTPQDDGPPKDTPQDDGPPKDTPPNDGPPKDTPPDAGPPKDTPQDDGPPKDTPPDDDQPKDTPPDDDHPKDAPSDGGPLKVNAHCTNTTAHIENSTKVTMATEQTVPILQSLMAPLETMVASKPTMATPQMTSVGQSTGILAESTSVHEAAIVSIPTAESTSSVEQAGINCPGSVPECGQSLNCAPESSSDTRSTPEVKSKVPHNSSMDGRNQQCGPRVVRSIVTEIFEGTLISKVKCLSCKKASVTQEVFQDLALPIPGRKEMSKFAEKGEDHSNRTNGISKKVYNVISYVIDLTKDSLVDPHTSLVDCLNAYFDSYELKGENRYFCSNCKSLQNGVKKMKVTRLPEILCVHLKRFRYDAYISRKIGRHVSFPLVGLNLSPYLHKTCEGPYNYELMAVITHYGGVSGGHYIAFAKNSIRNQWYEYNDTHVDPVSAGTVTSAEGYVLFYRKMNETEPRSQFVGSIIPPPSATVPGFYISRHWLLLLTHHSSPGPVFCEHACEHGGVLPPRRMEDMSKKVTLVTKETWDELIQRYGGGPALKSLEVCAVCQDHLKSLNERRKKEKNDIHQIQTRTYALGKRREPCLVPSSWVQKWKNFIHCETLEAQPPGAIDNSQMLEDKNGTFVYNGHPYHTLSEEVWSYFVQLYGGGPTLMICAPQLSMN